VFGSGNHFAVQVNSGSVTSLFAFPYQPYFTDNGISRGLTSTIVAVDTSNLSAVTLQNADQCWRALRRPLNEKDTVNLGWRRGRLKIRSMRVHRVIDFVNAYGAVDTVRAIRMGADTRIIYVPHVGFAQRCMAR
jgi:hypothetical protein